MNYNLKKKIIFIAIVTVLFLIIFNLQVRADTTFKLSDTTKSVYLNGTGHIDYEGNEGDVTWKSNNADIAEVDEYGMITGKKIGTTTITAENGGTTLSCEINVVYSSIHVSGNSGYSGDKVLILDEHPTENLNISVYDAKYEEISNAEIKIESSNADVVSVDQTAKTINAVKAGSSTITVSAAGVTNSFEVNVYDAPKFTDFSKANYEVTGFNDSNNLQLKITGITPNIDDRYSFIITKDNNKPNLKLETNGALDLEANGDEYLLTNTEENYMYNRTDLKKYFELNQDIYIWIIQETSLGDTYYNNNGESVNKSTKIINDGKKLEREELQLNKVVKSFLVSSSNQSAELTSLSFWFPSNTENRKFTLKIGKVTDNNILSKIQKNDYNGIKELLNYAKNNNSIYNMQLTTTNIGLYSQEKALFDGKSLLEDKAYYYIYVNFDDENGKYYPVEGVNIAQASVRNNSWDLYGNTVVESTTEDNLTPTALNSNKSGATVNDDTTAKGNLPQTGDAFKIISTIIASFTIIGLIFYYRFNKYKDIK